MREDLRQLLESIAFSEDARVTPTDRLRAAELLRDTSEPEPYDWAEGLREMSPEEIQIETDCHTAALYLLASDDERRTAWPETMRAVESILEERFAERDRMRKNGLKKKPANRGA